MKKRRKARAQRRQYSTTERRQVVARARQVGLSAAAREAEVPLSTLYRWVGRGARRAAGRGASQARAAPSQRRYSAEEKAKALALLASGLAPKEVAKAVGATTESLRLWRRAAQGAQVPAAPEGASRAVATGTGASAEPARPAQRDTAHGLSEVEQAAILELKKEHPSMGPAQLRVQLKRFRGWRVSVKAIARVLRDAGYERVHRGSKPKGIEYQRFEAPRRNALWQMDYADVRLPGERLHLLVILDDYSRFAVGHVLTESPTAAAALGALRQAIARHGKPEAIRTDRGGGFTAGEFRKALESELIDHIVGRPYRPEGGGKVEALIGTIRRELWEVRAFSSRQEAEAAVAAFLAAYNEARAHMGIDGLTPADRFYGRADRVLARIQALARGRQQALAVSTGGAIEEAPEAGALEVLRLVLVGDALELRFCGSRFSLGRIRS
ncbi:MAG TPA: IS3 family transposase [Burkholderiales bacterium]|nr:IS3 family transposase [Burkholderiales bacterium]